jgi:hypothetical protein
MKIEIPNYILPNMRKINRYDILSGKEEVL